ncbi:MAG: Ger(x)C family spore germination protein [Acetivibrionales bacterium]|jgi:spore germination protein KC
MKEISVVKKTALLFIILALILCSGCFDATEIDEFGYTSAIGLDKGKTNHLKMTFQIEIPKNIGGGEGGGSEGKSFTITSVETPTIYSGMNMINAYISKRINTTHTKVIVISEELAREGIEKYIQAFVRGREFRPNMYIIIAKGSAEDYIKNVDPKMEIHPAKYYELNTRSFWYTGFTAETSLFNFYLQQECTCSQPVADLGAVGRFESTDEFDLEGSTYKEKGREYPRSGDFTAGEIPSTGEEKSVIFGLAVFDGGKMVGTLDGQEALYYLMLTGQYKYSYITFLDPLSNNNYVVLNVKQRRKPVRRVEMSGDKPNIYAKIMLEADFESIQSGINYESVENHRTFEQAAEEFLQKEMLLFLKKTTQQFNSDICQFGKNIKGRFLTWDEWMEFEWLKKYSGSSFNIEVDLKVRRPGLMIRSTPGYSSKGEGV